MSNNSNLYRALFEAVIEPEIKYMSELRDSDYEFSVDYKKRIKNITAGCYEKPYTSIKLRFKVIAGLIAAALYIGTVGAIAGKRTENVLFGTYKKHNTSMEAVDYNFASIGAVDSYDTELRQEFFPDYIPGGFKLDDEMSDFDIGYYYFSNGDKYVIFEELTLSTTISIDTEHLINSKININGYEADIFSESGSDTHIILWREGVNIFMVTASGVSMDKTIRIAESVRAVK